MKSYSLVMSAHIAFVEIYVMIDFGKSYIMKVRVIVDFQTMIVFTMEMLGTVAFAASGAMVGAGKKMDIFGVCVLGVVTAVGGGMIRDIILGITPPGVFQNSVYAAVATDRKSVV